MEERKPDHLQIFLEGEAGHNGNVLATTLLVKLNKLLNFFHRMERLNTGAASRRTEFEVTRAEKYNPTVLALKPVPKVAGYNPVPAFDWTISQLQAVAAGRETDQRVDSAALQALVEIAANPKDGAYGKFWIESGSANITMDDSFAARALAAAARVRALQGDPRWHVGVSFGEVTGGLRAVLDERGEQEFVIHPAVGADRIVCKFTAEQRALMNNYLFRVVTVAGKLHYGEDSPHPKFVEMHSIREKSPSPTHLLDLRGLFSGLEKPAVDLTDFTYGR